MKTTQLTVFCAVGILIVAGSIHMNQRRVTEDNETVTRIQPPVIPVKKAKLPVVKQTCETHPDYCVDEEELTLIVEPITLWSFNTSQGISSDLPESIIADPDQLRNLQVGQEIEFKIPGAEFDYHGMVEETHSQPEDKVRVWSGLLQEGDGMANFTISQEVYTTTVMLVTSGIDAYQAEIDNFSGEGEIMDASYVTQFP